MKKNSSYQELCENFEKAQMLAWQEARPFVEEAQKQLQKAIDVAEKYGVMMNFGICPLYNTYYPESMRSKWEEKIENLSDDEKDNFMNEFEITDGGMYPGWEHSDIC